MKRSKIKKSATLTDETTKVGRLTDMDTREVSIVDRAANKRTFLVVKRDKQESGTDMADTDTIQSVIHSRVEEALGRVDSLKAALEAATVSKDAGDTVPAGISSEIRCVQYMLKSLAGVTSKSVMLIPMAGDLEVESLTETVKASSIKVLDEVRRRLNTLKGEVLETDILDADQVRKLDSAADMLTQVPLSTSKSILVLSTSLDDDARAETLAEIEKAMAGLSDLFFSLQTKGVAKSAHVADAFDVCSVLDGHAENLEKVIASILLRKNDSKPDLFSSAIMDIRAIQKGVGADAEALKEIAEPMRKISVVAKAAGMFHARWRENGGDVVLTFPDEKIGEFSSFQAAEAEAFKMNVQAVLGLGMAKADDAKKFEVKVVDTDKYQVVGSDGEVAWEGTDVVEAAKSAARLTMGNEQTTIKTDNTESATKTDETTTKKVGRPMAAKKLTRFKDAVKLLKEAIDDAATGSLSMEKFSKGIESLGSLVDELQLAKRISEHQDPEGDRGTDQNVGSGSQPDTSTTKGVDEVVGEGAPNELKSILKRVENLEEQGSEKDKLIAKLRSQVKTMKQVRSAPSTVPGDEDTTQKVKKGEQSEAVAWPADMNDYTE